MRCGEGSRAVAGESNVHGGGKDKNRSPTHEVGGEPEGREQHADVTNEKIHICTLGAKLDFFSAGFFIN